MKKYKFIILLLQALKKQKTKHIMSTFNKKKYCILRLFMNLSVHLRLYVYVRKKTNSCFFKI